MSLKCNMKFYVIVVFSFVLSITAAAPLLEQEVENEGEFGDYFEGDMVLSKEQEDAIDRIMDMDPATRNGLIDGAKRWPNRTVVYDIDDDNFDPDQLAMIEAGLLDIASKSCLRFRKREHDEEHAVMIQGSQNGCFSHVGYNPTLNEDGDIEQVLNLDKACFKLGNIVHQVLHTLGFHHMQSSLDRDDYVTILWENVVPGAEENFARYNNDSVNHGIPYDYDSVMHYPESVFSKNRKQTIVPKQGSGNGCYSNVGFNPGENEDGAANQVLNLAKGCFKHGTVVHEMLHTLGFYHMQSTYDRDDFVTMVWENIKAGSEHNFAKYNNDTVTDYGVVYDYGSVMHYPEKAFSKNGNRTIIPTQENVTIGQRNGLSESDILKLNKMYCEESNGEEVAPPKDGSHDKVIIVDK